jgi:flagellar basal body-associated protein FliL
MAEKEKKSEAPPAAAPAPAPAAGDKSAAKKGGLLGKTPVLVGGAMLLEGIVLIAGVYVLRGSGPTPASGAELVAPAEGAHGEAAATGDKNRSVEVKLIEFRAQNKQSGRTFLYDVSMSVLTKAKYEQEIKQSITDHEALIHDRIRTIIAQSDPDKLAGGSEPGMETLRRQVKHEMEMIVGEGKIQEILISRFIPFRTDF